MTSEKKDLYQEITDKVLAAIEAGTAPWVKPWKGTSPWAISHETGKTYSILNQILLGKPGEYITWGQVQKAGGKVINKAGKEIDFQAAVELMDDEIREALHAEGYETEQEFFSAYEAAHAAKYGEEWELSKSNPQY